MQDIVFIIDIMRKIQRSLLNVCESFGLTVSYVKYVDEIMYLNNFYRFNSSEFSGFYFIVSKSYYAKLVEYDLLDLVEFPLVVDGCLYFPSSPMLSCDYWRSQKTMLQYVQFTKAFKILCQMPIISAPDLSV